ncbi:MAG: transglutaminase-like domain-containing protein [Cellulosilyticaceae bacterium]
MKNRKYTQSIITFIWSCFIIVPTYGAIDTKDLAKGVIHISYSSPAKARAKVMIEKDKDKYTYNLDATGKVESYPLQLGNGTYKVSVLENTTGSKYKLIESENVTLNMTNPNDVYLASIQNVEWDTDSEVIKKGKQLTASINESPKKVSALYDYVVQGYAYDYKKLATLPTTYLPVIDKTFKEKVGICYDFSALYASMLRSQGTPTKLVKGYTPNAQGYHAWNEAYDAKTGEWAIIDTTYDLQVIKGNKAVKMKKSSKDYQKVNEY